MLSILKHYQNWVRNVINFDSFIEIEYKKSLIWLFPAKINWKYAQNLTKKLIKKVGDIAGRKARWTQRVSLPERTGP